MENVFAIVHTSDIDGVGSAALVKRKYGVPLSHLFFAGYSGSDAEYIEERICRFNLKNALLVIADLGPNKEMEPAMLRIINKVKRLEGMVFWFDHHPWNADSVESVASLCDVAIVGENASYCGTEITMRALGFNDQFTKEFAEIVHYSDFNIKPKRHDYYATIGTYALSITSYNTLRSRTQAHSKLRHIADVISNGKLFDARIAGDAERFRKLNESRIKAMVKRLYIGKQIAVGFSEDIQSTAGCAAVYGSSKKDISVYINVRNGHGHIRSMKADISLLANSLGGGGHPHASGFTLEDSLLKGVKTANGKEKVFRYIESKAAELYH
ncbi:MAG: hypothetical protein KGH72_03180 [Candidatus Micrarchaeota archaeon]|nr:hypothetical protein [Candidatus Micrarchaeota archaeon]